MKTTFEFGPKALKRTEGPTYPWVRLYVFLRPFRADFKSKLFTLGFFYVNYRVRLYSYMRAWPWARVLAHLGVGLVLVVWGVCKRGLVCGRAGSKFFFFGF